jgi:hypothetical protein
MKDLKKIKEWVENQNFTIRDGREDFLDYSKKEIVLYNGNWRSERDQVFTLLHECGHLVVSKKRSYERDYKSLNIANFVDARHTNSNMYKYKKLREEMMAWEEGYKLATKLGLEIDQEEYDKYASKCWMTYVKFFGS